MEKVLNIREIPKHLYHYTSLSNLALILENKTLRFTRLDLVNDPTEATADVENVKQLIFASCWTAEPQDELSMWKMYSPHKFGVRIKLPSNPFTGREQITVLEQGGAQQYTSTSCTIQRSNAPAFTKTINGPNKIYYTNDEKTLRVKCHSKDEIQNYFHLTDAGLIKDKCWEFEKEWRYRILATPLAMAIPFNSILLSTITDVERCPVISTFVDVQLDETSFDELEITLYPDPDPALRLLVEALLHKHNIKAPVLDSKLKVKW